MELVKYYFELIGIEYWSDNSSYVGEYLNGKKHGHGVYFSNNGSNYEGEWLDNKFNGYVKLIQ
jgi:hypothetical protein